MTARVRIGISGWRYAPWRGVYYPKGLRQADELAFAAGQFPTIEINGSFYSLQTATLYRAWYRATPPDFVFAVKGSRFITHMLRLRGVERALANFFASGVLCLGEKLGPFLWQLPPTLPFDERIEPFLASLPRDTAEAAALAEDHDDRVREPAFGDGPPRKLRHAVEIRHPSFCVPAFTALLRRYGVALVIADTAGHFPYCEDITSDFVYVRLHGDEELYRSGYSAGAIAHWARRVHAFEAGSEPDDAVRIDGPAPPRRGGRDVYVYFDNDVKVHAPFDALALATAARGLRSSGAMATRKTKKSSSKTRRSGGSSRSSGSSGRTRKTSARSGSRRYGSKAQSKVKRAMHERKHGELRSGRSGRKVTSRKQAIAIGLSEARRAGGKVPPKKSRKSSGSRSRRGRQSRSS